MKKSVLLAIIGAAALTGCQNEVMNQREYVPAPKEDSEVVNNAAATTNPAVSDRSAEQTAPEAVPGATAETAPAKRGGAAAATAEFPPMTGTFDNSGVSSEEAAGSGSAAAGEYIVKSGDTLGKIAIAHHVRLTALMKANNLTEKDAKHLRVGRKLVIPSGKDAAAVRGGKAAKAGKSGKREFGGNAAPTLQPGEYIVKAGDTPERIARRAGVKLSALMEANNFTEEKARRLQIGQKIVIPGKGAAKAEAKKPAAEAKPAAPKAEAAKTETAKPAADDELEREMNSTTVKGQTPATAAPAATDAAPTPVATTPAPAAVDEERTSYVQVKEDITIGEFARQQGTTPEAIRQLNPDLTGDKLVKGRIYEVPKK